MNLQEIKESIRILQELRRNPAQNQKMAGHQEAIQFLKSKGASSTHDNNYGVSMTTIPKLGVNPNSGYNTPLGIYFYPASYYIEQKSTGGHLEFQDGAAYIQIFSFDPSDVLELDLVDESEYNRYIGLLHSNINGIATLLGQSEKSVSRGIDYLQHAAPTDAKIKSQGGYLWYVLWQLSQVNDKPGSSRNNQSQAPRSSVIWNSLFRLIGVNIIIDNGSKVIHENEPCQGVVINPRSIHHATTIKNIAPMSPHEAERTRISNTAKKIDTGPCAYGHLYIATAIFNDGRKEHVRFKAENTAAAKKIGDKHWANAKDLKGVVIEYSNQKTMWTPDSNKQNK